MSYIFRSIPFPSGRTESQQNDVLNIYARDRAVIEFPRLYECNGPCSHVSTEGWRARSPEKVINMVILQVDLQDSSSSDAQNVSGIFIKNVIPNSPAGRSGGLQVTIKISSNFWNMICFTSDFFTALIFACAIFGENYHSYRNDLEDFMTHWTLARGTSYTRRINYNFPLNYRLMKILPRYKLSITRSIEIGTLKAFRFVAEPIKV